MGIRVLSTASLGEVDQGMLARLIDTAIAQCVEDCDDRPPLKAARKVTITLGFQPELDQKTNDCGDVTVSFRVDSKLPPRDANDYRMQRRTIRAPDGEEIPGVVFACDFPDSPNQLSLLDGERDEPEPEAKEETA